MVLDDSIMTAIDADREYLRLAMVAWAPEPI
jgi:hypothetical protein